MPLKIVILAAGQGKRMHSKLPKVLHTLAGKPLLQWVIDAATDLNPAQTIVIYGHGGEQVRAAFTSVTADAEAVSFGVQATKVPQRQDPSYLEKITWVEQTQQLGTGHALQQAQHYFNDDDQILVLLSDTPLISTTTLRELITDTDKNALGLVTVTLDDPSGLGRIIRDAEDNVVGIIEDKDCNEQQQEIEEINTGIMLLPGKELKHWLGNLTAKNAQGEYYLTDVIANAVADQVPICTIEPTFTEEVMGVNDRSQLAYLERVYQQLAAETLMLSGVSFADPTRFDLRGELDVAQDVFFDINVIVEGKVAIGQGSKIGSNVILKDCVIGENVTINSNVVIEESVISDNCIIGPFARLRPGTQLAGHVKIGNFVETKKAIVGEASKIPHLSYIGDANIGKNVNIGAGTITCNYDGVHKNITTIEEGAFIGSDSQLIAPVTIGAGAYIGAGSTISKNAPAGKLTISRSKQTVIENWKPPKKNE
ncbi:MAG: UDP-N-acetylglucosamine diphosphorylase/glucosamine-1-phosphate N-acetyltransferase [Gammaproteobacteria bacterium]|nr:UDP-N-acetylglucosamine diphosphorylase/glucosamine-1-phosphate N-acetyltransferase [Gammaproteobacteria bacterium]